MIEGAGSIVDAHTVEVAQPDGSKQRHTAKHILIATGSRAQLVNIPGKVCEISHENFLNYLYCSVMVVLTCFLSSSVFCACVSFVSECLYFCHLIYSV
jgi:hypothetical protein